MVEQTLQFIQKHWMLCSIAAVILGVLIFEEVRGKITGMHKISAQDAILMLNREEAVVVDLRMKVTFSDGHILGAINIPRADIDQHLKKLEAYKWKALILVDDYGTNLSSVDSKLQKAAFSKIYILDGGMRAWKEAKLPLNKR